MMLAAAATSDPKAPPGFYRWVTGDLRTGRIYRTVDVLGSWSTVFDGPDSLQIAFPVYSFRPEPGGGYGFGPYGQGPYGVGDLAGVQRAIWPDVLAETAPCKSFLAVAWVNGDGSENWLAGGPIWTRDFSRTSGMVTVGAAGLESYFDHRMVLPVLAAGQSPSDVSSHWTAAELGLIAKRLVEQAQSWTDGDVPLDLPDDADLGGAGTRHERTYPGYELGRVTQRLRDLSGVIDGPELQFVPRRADPQHLEWAMRIGVSGNRMLLTQSGRPWVVDDTVPRSMVADVTLKEDGSGIGTDAYAAGQGSGEGRPVARASSRFLLDQGFPLLEIEQQATDTVSNMATLQAHADGLLARRDRPTQVFDISVSASQWWSRSRGARAGDWLTVKSKGKLELIDGDNELRILSMSGDGDSLVRLSCVPKREVAA